MSRKNYFKIAELRLEKWLLFHILFNAAVTKNCKTKIIIEYINTTRSIYFNNLTKHTAYSKVENRPKVFSIFNTAICLQQL